MDEHSKDFVKESAGGLDPGDEALQALKEE